MKKKNEQGAIVVEATISLTAFMFLIVIILSITNICLTQAKMSVLIDGIAKDVSNYSYIYSMTGLMKWEQGVAQGAQQSRTDINTILDNSESLYTKIDTLVDDVFDKKFWESLKNLVLQQAVNEGKGQALNLICKDIAKARMINDGQDADTYLRYLGISEGVNGLDFSKSEFCPNGSNDIKIIVHYKVHALELLGIEKEFEFEQCAQTKAWNSAAKK